MAQERTPGKGRRPAWPPVVLLDALGTLLRLEPPAPLLARELERRHGDRPAFAEAEAAVAAEIAHYRANIMRAGDAPGLAGLRRECARVMRDALPPRFGALAIDEALALLLASLRFRAYPEVPAVLEALRGDGVRLVVVSNWDISLRSVLRRAGLLERVDGVIASAQAGFAKPDPRVFELGLRRAGARRRDALHVGDDLVADVEGARAAGIAALWVNRRAAPVPAGVSAIERLTYPLPRP